MLFKIMKKTQIIISLTALIISCGTTWNSNHSSKTKIEDVEIYKIAVPVAGNYPQSLYKFPYKERTSEYLVYSQTVQWEPEVQKTFDTDTVYTAVVRLDPLDKNLTFKGIETGDIKGFPSEGVRSITTETNGDSIIIKIVYEKTAGKKAERKLVFWDDFDGNSLDFSKWDYAPEWDRQGRSSWRDDMVSVNGGFLRLAFKRDPVLGAEKSRDRALANNWIRCGAVRTQKKDGSMLFSGGFGFYEARLKLPNVNGIWGGFWLMSPSQWIMTDEGVIGTEIDIVETYDSPRHVYNAALNWNGYDKNRKSVHSFESKLPDIDIFDGEFHVFALDWSPSEYIFYVDGEVFWRVDGGVKFKNSGINRNPNYIKLTMESGEFSGAIPDGFTTGEMLVDYVRVYSQPQYSIR
jgi:beta-glucanase (GH16 family)